MTDGFTGFMPETLEFLGELGDNNNREWFTANRDRYEAHYLTPAMQFVAAMESVAAVLTPPHRAVAKVNGSIRRINRDVRFSKDKSPYDPRIHLVFWTGDHPNRSPAIHLVLQADRLGYGAGQWAFDAGQIEQYRQAISKPTPRKAFIAALSRSEAIGCERGEAELKKVPKGYEPDAGWADNLRYKTIVSRTQTHLAVPDELFSPQAISYCASLFTEMAPLNGWINKHITV